MSIFSIFPLFACDFFLWKFKHLLLRAFVNDLFMGIIATVADWFHWCVMSVINWIAKFFCGFQKLMMTCTKKFSVSHQKLNEISPLLMLQFGGKKLDPRFYITALHDYNACSCWNISCRKMQNKTTDFVKIDKKNGSHSNC